MQKEIESFGVLGDYIEKLKGEKLYNSKFSFSYIGCHNKVRENSLSYKETGHFQSNTLGRAMNPLISPIYGLNCTTTVLWGVSEVKGLTMTLYQASSNSSGAIKFTFGLMPLGKVGALYPPSYGLIVLLLFFYKDGFSIK